MEETPNLQLPYIMPAQAQKHVTHNEALGRLDCIVQLAVQSRTLAAPPAEPVGGDRYIVAASALGAWSGHEGQVAVWQDALWQFVSPLAGWLAFVADEATMACWDGDEWSPMPLRDLRPEFLGVGTVADVGNPFSAKINNALWTARSVGEGGDGDMRMVFNKETSADVLSVLMQTGYSGRAEWGLVGNDAMSLRLSPDGGTWKTVLRANDTGIALGGDFDADEKLHLRGEGGDAGRLLVEAQSGGATGIFRRSSDDTVGADIILQKSRGTLLSPSAPAQDDSAGSIQWHGSAADGSGVKTAVIEGQVIAAAPGASDMAGRLLFHVSPAGSDTPAEIARLDATDGLSIGGAFPVIDANRHFRLRSYTLSTLPSAAVAAGQTIYCSDLGGGGGQLISDGVYWRRTCSGGQQTVTSDSNFTLTVLTDAEEIRHLGTLTLNRTVTLSTTGAYPGARFRVVRSGGNAFTLTVAGLKTLVADRWVDFVYNGTAWYVSAYGAM